MSHSLIWNDAVAYFLQIGLLVGLAAFLPPLLRLRSPGARLAFWQLLLAACLVLPLVEPWRQQVLSATVHVSSTITDARPVLINPRPVLSAIDVALALLCAGVLARLGWLVLGFWRLQRYRRHSQPLQIPVAVWTEGAEVRISSHIASPVTFGFLNPVILLPVRFPELDPGLQQAILCHEALHVRRRDWLFTVAEELIRAFFWFHPAIWWLLGEIQLAREQAVDLQVVEMTNARDQYVDALLAIAGAAPGAAMPLDLAPAPLFLRKRHLKQRVVSILKEVRMSKLRTVSSLAAGVAVLVAACCLVTGTFPLAAAPQLVADPSGVNVETGGAQLLHRSAVSYPREAIAKGIEGTVVAQLKLDANGNVADATILSGPDELRKPVLQSVLNWHFTKDDANTTRQVSIAFHLPETNPTSAAGVTATPPPPPAPPFQYTPTSPAQGTPGHFTYDVARGAPGSPAHRVAVIGVSGLPTSTGNELLSRLNVHQGDQITPEGLFALSREVKQFDEHLNVTQSLDRNGDVNIMISTPNFVPPPPPPASQSAMPLPTGPIPIGGRVQASKLISQPQPIYPQAAKDARISGTVQLATVIGPDGSVVDIQVIMGHPLLVPAALAAVRNWVYQPTLLNGNPVAVSTTIDVNFTLSQ